MHKIMNMIKCITVQITHNKVRKVLALYSIHTTQNFNRGFFSTWTDYMLPNMVMS